MGKDVPHRRFREDVLEEDVHEVESWAWNDGNGKEECNSVVHVFYTIFVIVHGQNLRDNGKSQSGAAMLCIFVTIKFFPDLGQRVRRDGASLVENGNVQHVVLFNQGQF